MKNWLLIFALLLGGCSVFKAAGRTINDAGAILCNLFATNADPAVLDGLTPEVWCGIHENLKPFIDEALAAQKAAAMQVQNPNASDAGVQ